MAFLTANSTSAGKLPTSILRLETFAKSLAVPPFPARFDSIQFSTAQHQCLQRNCRSRRDVWTHQEQHRHARPWLTGRASTRAHVPVPQSRRREASFRVEGAREGFRCRSGCSIGSWRIGANIWEREKKRFRQKKHPAHLILSYLIPPSYLILSTILSHLIRYRCQHTPPIEANSNFNSNSHNPQSESLPESKYLSPWRRKQSRRQRPVSRNGIPSLHFPPSQSSSAQS